VLGSCECAALPYFPVVDPAVDIFDASVAAVASLVYMKAVDVARAGDAVVSAPVVESVCTVRTWLLWIHCA